MGRGKKKGEIIHSYNQSWIAYIRKEESRKIPYSDVLFIEQQGTLLHIKRDEDTLEIVGRMSEITKNLREPFSQCHAYLIINFDRVDSMAKGQIVFDNDRKEIKFLGRDSFAETRKKFNHYLLGEEQDNDKSVQKTAK
jgi:DNA-binding LytR/AlgR family response regulator